MTEEMTEIIRVLQLTTYGEDEWDSDKLTLMKKALSAFESNQQNGHDWLQVRRERLVFIWCYFH